MQPGRATRLALRAAETLAACVLLLPRPAWAYTIETPITAGCHESISAEALRGVRASGLGLPLADSEPDDRPLVADLPFTAPDDLKDIGGATLLLGVRDNDVASLGAVSFDQIAQVTADPKTQRYHCLRSDTEKEPNGTSEAVADCQAFIKEKLLAALDGLGADGTPDARIRAPLAVNLALRGTYTASVPVFYLHAGQAIHAIQDSFAHTFRDAADPHKISVTLDWIDYADNRLNEATDGPPHLSQLDRCDDPDALRAEKHRLAIEASREALAITLDRTMSRDAKSAAIDAFLQSYVVYDGSGHCSLQNHWCNAAENGYRSSGCGCRLSGGPGAPAGAALGGLVALAGALRRSRRRQRGAGEATRRALGVAAAAALVLTPAVASAQQDGVEHAPKGPIAALNGESQAGQRGSRDPAGSLFAHVAFGASYDHAALAFALGAKYQLARSWMIGLDAEWNPWIVTDPSQVRAGTANLYASVVRRYQMAYEPVNFRTTAIVGASALLIDLPGAPRWSVGPVIGISFIGVEWKVARGFYLVVDPMYLVLPVPHITGAPLGYYQYRSQVALEFGG